MVVNVGDMLQRLTNHVLPSTTHRVVNPPPERRGHSRYSMPFFLHPAPDFLIETLPGCVSAANPDRHPEPITAHDRSEEHTSELQSLMRISYAVFCLKTKKKHNKHQQAQH